MNPQADTGACPYFFLSIGNNMNSEKAMALTAAFFDYMAGIL
jgi:hypothetical protein